MFAHYFRILLILQTQRDKVEEFKSIKWRYKFLSFFPYINHLSRNLAA